MPDTKNKYSDDRLNKAQQDYDEKFGNITSSPDMQALGDQGDAIARDLKKSEGNTTEPTSTNDPDGVRQAETESPSQPEPSKQTTQTKSGGWSGRRKALTGAGVGGGILALVASLFALLPLKVPGIMSMVTSQTMQRVEQITEKRAKTIIGRAILTKFGTHTGVVITGEGAFKTLVASMRTSGFEKRLAEKGLIITATSDGVKLTQNGKPLGGGKSLKNEKAILDALENDNISNKVLKNIIREEIPSWRWMKRAKFAKWLRIKYGIPRYGLTNSDNPDSEEKKKEMDTERAERAAARTSNNFKSLLSCILSGSCEAIDGSGEASNKEEEAGETANDVDAAAEESVESVREHGLGTSEEATKSISKLLVGKLGTKAIPIIGWIDLIATLDHFAHEAGDNDYIGKIAAYYKGAAYAAIYAEWSGYSSQVQLGALDPEYAGVLADELNDAEKAQAFQAIMGDSSKGEPIETLVNSDKPSGAKKLYDSILNGPLGFSNKYIGHPILNAYYETIGGGGFLGWVAGGLGNLLGSIFSPITGILGDLTPDSVKDLASDAVAKLGPFILKTFGLTIDEFDKGPKLMNNIMGGGVVSSNEYCKEIGCRRLSSEQTYLQNKSIAVERAADTREKGVFYAMFNTDQPTSLTNQLAYSMPTSVESGVSSLARTISSVPSRLASFIVPRSQADKVVSYEGLYGVAPYGATAADVSQPLAPELMTGDTCPDVNEGDYNNCAIDTEVAEAMLCEFKPDEGECAENTPNSSGEAAFSFTIGSYNQKRALSAEEHQKAVDNILARNMDVVGTQETSEPKFSRYKNALAAHNYGSYPEQMGPNQTCVGAQAIFYSKDKFTFEKGEYFEVPRYPDAAVNCGGGERTTGGHDTEGGKLPPVWTHIPIVWLKENATGRTIIVMNTHNVANVPGAAGTTPAYSRVVANKIYIQQIERLKTENQGTPIVLTGDFNEGTGVRSSGNITWQGDVNNLLFCMFAKNGLMFSAAGQKMKCGGYGIGGVDYIYAVPEIEVESYHEIERGQAASDHKAIYATLKVPGTAGEGSLRIATFNILHVGTDSFEKQWRTRLPKSIDTLKENKIVVAGLQEVRPEQHDLLTSQSYATDTFDIFPKSSQRSEFTPNPIIWDKSMFSLVSGKRLPIEYDNGNKIDHGVLVKLKDNEGNEFYVLNTHDPANVRPGSDATNELSRLRNAQSYKEILSGLRSEGKPMFLTGDFNNGYTMSGNQGPYQNNPQNLTYCVISSSGFMKNVWDIEENKNFTCPRNKTPDGAPIDHIYAGNIDGVSKVWTAPRIKNGSDHPTVMAEIKMPWSKDSEGGGNDSGGGVVGGWSWPLGLKAWKDHRSSFLGSHYSNGGFLGNGSSSVDISWGSSDTGAPIYSMLDGIVKVQPLGRSSYRCTGTPNPSNNGGMLIESRIDGHVIQIAYAHGSDPKFHENQPVKSGQQILKLGNVGNSCGSHLHMDATYDGKNVCLQDIFLSLDRGKAPNMNEMVRKATLTCAGRG